MHDIFSLMLLTGDTKGIQAVKSLVQQFTCWGTAYPRVTLKNFPIEQKSKAVACSNKIR